MKHLIFSFCVLCLGVVLLTSLACEYHATYIHSVPTPAAVSSNKDTNGYHYQYLKWKEGLRVLIVDKGFEFNAGKGTVDGDRFVQTITAKYPSGASYNLEMVTVDGKTSTFKINDQSFDLALGKVFAIQVEEKNVKVHQIDKDLSKLENMVDCSAFVVKNTDIQNAVDGK